MKRQNILGALHDYERAWVNGSLAHASHNRSEEQQTLGYFRQFTIDNSDCFERYALPGHFTASALVTNPSFDSVLLTHHRKLNMWLQLGGHAEGEHRLHRVAYKETNEESGLRALTFLTYSDLLRVKGLDEIDESVPVPFDIDRHLIPAHHDEPEHYHFDVRYVIIANDQEPVQVSDESHDVRWFALDKARTVTGERSMHRQFDKLIYLRDELQTLRGQLPVEIKAARTQASPYLPSC